MRLTASLLTGRGALGGPTDRPDLDPLMAATLRGPVHLYFGFACHLPVPSICSTRRPTQPLGSHDSPIVPQGFPFRVWTEEPSVGRQEWQMERLLVRKALQRVSRQRGQAVKRMTRSPRLASGGATNRETLLSLGTAPRLILSLAEYFLTHTTFLGHLQMCTLNSG